MPRSLYLLSIATCLLLGVGLVDRAAAADTQKELKQLDVLEGYQNLPAEKGVQKALTDVPKEPVETLIVWSEAKPSSGPAPLNVTLSADPLPGASDAVYTWTFTDGSPPATGRSVSHTFTAPGVHRVFLKVTGTAGALGEDELRIKVTQ
jgi:PKD domain